MPTLALRLSLWTVWVLVVGAPYSVANANSTIVNSCIDTYLSSERPEGEVLGFSRGLIENVVTSVITASGLVLQDIQIVECPGAGSAFAKQSIPLLKEGKPGRFLVYDPDWLAQISGQDQWPLIMIIAHEIGHFANGHFAYINVDSKVIETEADRFAGCVVGRMRGDWGAIAETIIKIRKTVDEVYPDRLQSTDAARAGFEACASASTVARNPPGTPLTADQKRAIEGILGWVHSEASKDHPNFKEIPNLRALSIAYLTSMLTADRFIYSPDLRHIIFAFQEDQGLPVTRELDNQTVERVREAVEAGDIEPVYRRSDGESVHLRGCVYAEEVALAATIIGLKKLEIRDALLCGGRNEAIGVGGYTSFSEFLSLEELSLRNTSFEYFNPLSQIGQLKQLKVLNLRETETTSLEFLAGLSKLESLDLELTGISDTDLYFLRNLTALENLSLHGTNVSDISILARLKRLKALEISLTKIDDISPILSIGVERLEAWNTPVLNFKALSEIKSLDTLDARSESLSGEDLLAFVGHSNLEVLIVKKKWEGSSDIAQVLAGNLDLSISFRD